LLPKVAKNSRRLAHDSRAERGRPSVAHRYGDHAGRCQLPLPAAPTHVIGEETSQRLGVVPAQFRVIVTHRRGDGSGLAPERLIKGELPTEAMVAYVLVAKYAWHFDHIVGCAMQRV
jgi:transposase